jgi:putative membrane protein
MRESAFTLLSMVTAVALSSVDPDAVRQSQDFVTRAAIASRYQIEAGVLARDRGSEKTRMFAARIVDDHRSSQRELARLAHEQGLSLPRDLDAAHQAELARLGRAAGAEFDREYADQQVRAHAAVVDLFERESSGGRDTELRAFATEALPQLQGQLQRAAELPR